jgi:hypothetical protein
VTRRLLLILALVAALGLSFPAEIGDDLWTLSPYSSCADDGNPSVNVPFFALRASPDARLTTYAVPTLVMGAPARNEVRWLGAAMPPASVCAPSPPPPQRC